MAEISADFFCALVDIVRDRSRKQMNGVGAQKKLGQDGNLQHFGGLCI